MHSAVASRSPLITVVLHAQQEFEPGSRSRQLPNGRIVFPTLDKTDLKGNVMQELGHQHVDKPHLP